jgi:5-methylthioribose kinase
MSDAEPQWLDPSSPEQIEHYLLERRLLTADALPITVTPAGAGNMNLALRVAPARGRSFILKQGRPWVAKYPQIPAPVARTLVEAAFYEEVRGTPSVARLMPALLHVDPVNHVLVLEDVGTQGDFTPLYRGAALAPETLAELLDWLAHLSEVEVPPSRREAFANLAMLKLNHEHIFLFPLRPFNGLDLDAITAGLQGAAGELQRDHSYVESVAKLGTIYFREWNGVSIPPVSRTLVHGDYFPGSWLHAGESIRVIDSEFCFLGPREFDYAVLAAHLLMARAGQTALDQVMTAVEGQRLNADLVHMYAGIEIMRRLIGVAQLPLALDLEQKRDLLRLSRRLTLEPRKGFA